MTQVATEFESRPRGANASTRKPMPFWNRIKFLFWGGALFAFFFAAEMADNPMLPASEAFNKTLRGKWWLLALMGLELIRQIHYLICEHSASYYQFWRDKVFAGWNASISRIDPWKRHQTARTIKIVTILVVLNLVLAWIFDTNFFRAPYELLSFVVDATPTALQLVLFLTFWIGFQFGLIIWFATRGGVETFYPDDINTRFSDVWGQDPVLEKVKENLIFLDNPKMIEDKGGYVPSGLLLWGPPGTGKTLMAEAMAGETGKPFVNIDASQLNTMGMGVIKVKMLFRRLRRLALRYGGVVAFFDEADALGSRGDLAGQAPRASGLVVRGHVLVRRIRLPVRRHAPAPHGRRDRRGHRPGPADWPRHHGARASSWEWAVAAWAGRCCPYCSPSCRVSTSRAASSTATCGRCSGSSRSRRRSTAC